MFIFNNYNNLKVLTTRPSLLVVAAGEDDKLSLSPRGMCNDAQDRKVYAYDGYPIWPNNNSNLSEMRTCQENLCLG